MTFEENTSPADFAEQVRINQQKLNSELKAHYDFIVCGAGSSGSVVARRLAENPDVQVLLLEAGGQDDVPSVTESARWHENLGSDRVWDFVAKANPHLNSRSISLEMGKVFGGGSSVNLMAWVRGHKNDWDYFASEAGDPAWNYDSVLNLYKRIEDWRGDPEPGYRGQGGPVFLRPAHQGAVSRAFTEAARSLQIPTFPTLNGRMMEGIGGCSTPERINRDGKRQSIFRAYTYPYMDRPNLTVVTECCS